MSLPIRMRITLQWPEKLKYRANKTLTAIIKSSTMTKTKEPLLSPIQFTTNSNDQIGNTTIGESIGRNQRILIDSAFEPFLEREEYIKLLEDIRTATSDAALQAELEQRWTNEVSPHNKETNILLEYARYAWLYLELAKVAETNKDRDKAWAFNSWASVMVGQVVEKSDAAFKSLEGEKRSYRNTENGKGRIEYILPVKEEAARLLKELKPEGGWPTLASAILALEQPLADFINANRITVVKSKREKK
ncbi:hypothetical protein D3C75_534210 [compost metagenome]